jgi:hypothetical protein
MDSDPYPWLGVLGCCSPIIHLQQTSGKKSVHGPFTPQRNAAGTISGEEALQALATSFASTPDSSMPQRCAEIYLTLEIFFPTDSNNRAILNDLRQSIAYWRQFVPEVGLPLDQLAAAASEPARVSRASVHDRR